MSAQTLLACHLLDCSASLEDSGDFLGKPDGNDDEYQEYGIVFNISHKEILIQHSAFRTGKFE